MLRLSHFVAGRRALAPLSACALLLAAACAPALAGHWITAPSDFTHDPNTGERVCQYAPLPPVYTFHRDDYQQSGYRHHHASLRVGGNSDQTHIIEEWGRPVRPYGEWEHPFRPYSVPYDLWGPQPVYSPYPYYGYGPGPAPYGPFPYGTGSHGGPYPGGPYYGGPHHGGPHHGGGHSGSGHGPHGPSPPGP